MHTFVVVSGLPGSGKTTLAAALAKSLRIEHLDKDRLLETYFLGETKITRERRNELSRRADDELKAQALSHQSVVLSSWWRHPKSSRESGTPVNWLQEQGIQVVEVFCECPSSVAVRRFESRQRHPGHLDEQRSRDNLFEQLVEAELLGPLFPEGALICNTATPTPPSSVAALANQIKALSGTASEA